MWQLWRHSQKRRIRLAPEAKHLHVQPLSNAASQCSCSRDVLLALEWLPIVHTDRRSSGTTQANKLLSHNRNYMRMQLICCTVHSTAQHSIVNKQQTYKRVTRKNQDRSHELVWGGKRGKITNLFTYIAPQAAYAASAALCVTDRAVVQPRPQLKSALTDSGFQPFSRT